MKKPLVEKVEPKADIGCGKHVDCCMYNDYCQGMLQSIGGKITIKHCNC